MSNSVRPHRRQPSRLLCPWDSPGKNTGVGCRSLTLIYYTPGYSSKGFTSVLTHSTPQGTCDINLSFYRSGNSGTENWSNLLRVEQPISGKTRTPGRIPFPANLSTQIQHPTRCCRILCVSHKTISDTLDYLDPQASLIAKCLYILFSSF